MKPVRLGLAFGLLPVLAACQCSSDVTLRVRVVGHGEVVVGTAACADECELRVAPGTEARAVPAPGWRFSAWSGACEGDAPCLLNGSGELLATFVEEGVVAVTVSGPGTILGSDGRRCTGGECRWPTSGPLGLTPLPQSGAEFVGFSGACTGNGRCTLSQGAVTATFRLAGDELHFAFSGSGTGVVRDLAGDYSCSDTCTLRVPRGALLEFRAEAGTSSVFKGFSGACEGLTCRVMAPATVTAQFDQGRRLAVATAGNGGGAIQVDGVSCSAPCDLVVPTDAAVTVTATADDTSRFLTFSGDCAGSGCTLAPGTADLTVTAQFGSVLQWVRSFPVPSGEGHNVALYADEAGIVVAASVRRSMEVDGVVYTEPYINRNGSPYFIELGWDAGVQSVLPLYDYVDGGYTRVDVASMTRGPDGTLFAFGVCMQGHLQGQSCGELNMPGLETVPFVLEIADGGPRAAELRLDLQHSSPGGFQDSHRVGDLVVARVSRHDQLPNGRSGFYVRSPGADGGVLHLASDMLGGGGSFATSLRECVVDGESLLCASAVNGGFTGLGCGSSAPGGPLAIYRYTPSTGSCRLAWRMPLQTAALLSTGVFGTGRSGVGDYFVLGGTGNQAAVDFGAGFTLGQAAHVWIAGLRSGSIASLWSSEVGSGQLSRPVALVPSESGALLVLMKTGPILPGAVLPLFGVPLTVDDSAHVLAFDPAGNVTRRWPLLGGAANPEEIRNGVMTRVGEDIVVALMGSGYTFRGQPLAPDLRMRLFVLVFRE